MNGKERLEATLNHRQPDRVCVDIGATWISGMPVSAVDKLSKAVLGDHDYRVKVCEPCQMLGEIDDELRNVLGIDVVGRLGRTSLFGTDEHDRKPFTVFDGTEVLVPHNLNRSSTTAADSSSMPFTTSWATLRWKTSMPSFEPFETANEPSAR